VNKHELQSIFTNLSEGAIRNLLAHAVGRSGEVRYDEDDMIYSVRMVSGVCRVQIYEDGDAFDSDYWYKGYTIDRVDSYGKWRVLGRCWTTLKDARTAIERCIQA